ncbi:hypothetical protein R3P38DRAFT_2570403, partial [Favolaschia claudopus]
VGLFLRGRLPSSISVVGLSATLAPGKDTEAVCASLGLFHGCYRMIRRTNERPNIQISVQILTHGLAGYEFPDLLPFLASGRKAIIHFQSLPTLFRCYVYLWRIQPSTANKLRRVRMYHSLCPPAYNEKTIQLIDGDPRCQIILATIAFSNGINARSLLDSISLAPAKTLDILVQDKGRLARVPDALGRGIILVSKTTLTLAEKRIKSLSNPLPLLPTKKSKGGRKSKTANSMNSAMAQFLTESHCYIAFLNKHYQNPPLSTSSLDCIAANRALPCSLCLQRSEQNLDFPAPPDTPRFPPLAAPDSSSKPANSSSKSRLTRDERKLAKKHLQKFGTRLQQLEHKRGRFLEHPRSLFLPSSIQSTLLDKMLSISSLSDLQSTVHTWRHRDSHCMSLYQVILEIQTEIGVDRDEAREARNAAARAKRREKRKAEETEDDEEEADEDGEDDASENDEMDVSRNPSKKAKHTPLDDLTNTTKTRKKPEPQRSAALIAQEYGPGYKTRVRR